MKPWSKHVQTAGFGRVLELVPGWMLIDGSGSMFWDATGRTVFFSHAEVCPHLKGLGPTPRVTSEKSAAGLCGDGCVRTEEPSAVLPLCQDATNVSGDAPMPCNGRPKWLRRSTNAPRWVSCKMREREKRKTKPRIQPCPACQKKELQGFELLESVESVE